MQAIETKWYGPTNTRGAKIIARCNAGTLTVRYDHNLDADDNHREAARQLIKKLGWLGTWASGYISSLPNSIVHVSCKRTTAPGFRGYNEQWDVW